MVKPKKSRKSRPKPERPPVPELPVPLNVRYFPTTPEVTDEIQAWAEKEGVKIRAVVPVYLEAA